MSAISMFSIRSRQSQTRENVRFYSVKKITMQFYPRYSKLARVLAMALCLSVCVGVCHKSVFY